MSILHDLQLFFGEKIKQDGLPGTGDMVVFDGTNWVNDQMASSISVLLDGAGAEIADATQVPFGPLPVDCTITGNHARADQSGAIVVDVWASATWIPTDSDSITASAPITITASGDESDDTTLTGWTVDLPAGHHLIFNVDSCTSITWCLVTLDVTRGAV